ncbi:hypothetical protein CAOG_005281 [Capsaspora owczarzaki ATCC 30864]|uniref:Uncharacterized protein n=1 Tax=Capsaspora owczarzaki (strain ATCC 30864) TaxID=595528 RepID=A0A0D2WT09_CAPO3|nr:hypothetical protein CAOG_005281 [Capsaspora owczarzaki ATCC 30864]
MDDYGSVNAFDAHSLPMRFRSAADGVEYMLATSVARHMGRSLVDLFRTYPGLHRRQARDDEWMFLVGKGECFTTKATLVRAAEIELLAARTANKETPSAADALMQQPLLIQHIVTPQLPDDAEPSKTLAATAPKQSLYCFTPFERGDERPSVARRHAVQKPRNVFSSLFRVLGAGPASEALQTVAAVEEVLVPIRIDLDIDGFKYKDSFVWNLRDQLVTPEDFATMLCEDNELPRQLFHTLIVDSISKQLIEFASFNEMANTSSLPRFDDRRVPIKLDVQYGQIALSDQIEWDIFDPDNSPEEFAAHYCAELSLPSEYIPTIAHLIHEQVIAHRKLAITGDSHAAADLGLVGFPPVRIGPSAEDWTPHMEVFDPADLERVQQQRDREVASRRGATSSRRSAAAAAAAALTGATGSGFVAGSGVVTPTAGKVWVMPVHHDSGSTIAAHGSHDNRRRSEHKLY